MISKDKIENFNKKFDVVSVFIEHDGEILLVHRQDNKPQGNTWAAVAGKVDKDEELIDAIIREMKEEIGLDAVKGDCRYFTQYHLRYPDYDYLYHIYHLKLNERPELSLNMEELKDYQWISPQESLKLDLIQDEDSCIKWFYNIE